MRGMPHAVLPDSPEAMAKLMLEAMPQPALGGAWQPALPVDSPEPADHMLMQQYASGQVAAFDTLYTRHSLSVWRYVFRSVRDAAVADDLQIGRAHV